MIIPKLDIETEKKLFFKILEQKNKGVFHFYGKAVKEYLEENGLPLDWENLYKKRLYKCVKNHKQKPSHRLYCNPFLSKKNTTPIYWPTPDDTEETNSC